MPEKTVKEIDRWVAEGRFASRSDAIKTVLALYQERECTRQFHQILSERSKESGEKLESLVPLEDVT